MATFELDLNGLNANSDVEIGTYQQGIESILETLTHSITSRTHNPLADKLLDELKTNLDNKDGGIFAGERIDIEKHPKCWTETNRIGKSTIVVTNASDKLSTYEELNKLFINYLKSTSRFNAIDKKDRRDINIALDKLQQWQKDAAAAYVVRLRNNTGEALKTELDNCLSADNKKEISSFKTKIEEIQKLNANNVKTSAESLQCTQQVNTLRNELLKFNESLAQPKLAIAHLSEQLSIITKRWIDPFYENPRELSTIEKARKIAKMIIINLAEMLAVTAFILFFVFPPASFPVGVAASIGMLPVFDGIFEIARNIWYGRTPTKEQVLEVGIAIFIILGLTFCAYGVTAIGMSIMKNAANVGTKMVRFGTFMATKAMRFIDAFLNTIGIFFDAFQFHKAMQRESEKHINNRHKPVPFNKLMKLLHDKETDKKTDLQQKKKVIEMPDRLREFQAEEKKVGKNYYTYKASNDCYLFQKSKVEKIANWQKGYVGFSFNARKEVKGVKHAVREYTLLTIHASTTQRLESLEMISKAIDNWKASNNIKKSPHTDYVKQLEKLEKRVEREKEALGVIATNKPKESPYLFHLARR